MEYTSEFAEKLYRLFSKLKKRNKKRLLLANKKVNQVLKNPHRFKPLRAPMQNKRRVHVNKSFVLVYEIDEKRKVVRFLEFEHHDKAYKK